MNVVTTLDALRAVVDDYLKQDAFVFDVETMPRPGAPSAWRGDPRRNVVKWIALATAGRADVIPLGHPNGEFLGWDRPLLKTGRDRLAKGLELREQDYSRDQKKWTPQFAPPPEQLCWSVDVRDVLRPLFFSGLTKIGHNLAFDLESIAKHFDGEIPPPPHADTMIAGFLLDPGDKGHLSLKDCSKRELDFDMVKGVGKEIEAHSFDEVARYAWRDARLTWLLWSTVYEQELRDTGLWNLWRLEMDVLQVVVHMEMTGAPVDESRLRQLDGELRGMQTDVEVEILRLAGNPDLNINSNEQVSRLLYSPKKEGGQGLKPRILTDGGKKRKEAGEDLTFKDYSVSDDALKYHEGNTLVDNLRRYGDIERLITGFIVPYLGGENTNGKAVESLLIDGRIHGRFNQIGAETGRFSSREPNLQQVPARSEEGKRIRSAFVAPPGYKLVVADYSQIEPRILADLSQEPALLEAYLQEGGDVYTALASPFGFDRQVGKTMFLSIAYGTGPSKLASVTGLSLAESKSIIYEKFPKAFPKIEAAKQAVVRGARARKPPHIRTLLGRRRYLPGLLSSDTYVRSRNERQAFNSYIQGSAADINKIGLVRTDQSVTPLGASPILTVHDEVVVLTPEQHAEEVAHLVTEAMTGVHLLKTVPLVAETKIADNWADGK